MNVELAQTGLKLTAPVAGDVVTVRLKPPSKAHTPKYAGVEGALLRVNDSIPEHLNAGHYKHTAIWRVLAVNGNHAVVERATSKSGSVGSREIMPIDLHDWFEASDLLAAFAEGKT